MNAVKFPPFPFPLSALTICPAARATVPDVRCGLQSSRRGRTSSSRSNTSPSRCATSMTSSQSLLIALSGEIRWRTRSTRISPPPPGIEPSPAALKSPMIFSSGSLNTSRKWMNSLGLKPWMLNLRKFVFDVREQIQIPLLRQLRMMAALHQHLRAAERDRLLDFFVHLVERDDVGIVVLFHAVKRAELAIDVADVRVIDVAVNDVGDDVVAATVEILRLGELAAAVGERAEFFQRQMIKPQRLALGKCACRPRLFAATRPMTRRKSLCNSLPEFFMKTRSGVEATRLS